MKSTNREKRNKGSTKTLKTRYGEKAIPENASEEQLFPAGSGTDLTTTLYELLSRDLKNLFGKDTTVENASEEQLFQIGSVSGLAVKIHDEISQDLKNLYGEKVTLKNASVPQLNSALWAWSLKKVSALEKYRGSRSDRKVYYVTIEVLPGRLLGNNLLNLGLLSAVNLILGRMGYSIEDIEEMETDPSLGNGGLGRLGPCIHEGATTLGYNMECLSLHYHYGLGKQVFRDKKQTFEPDPWDLYGKAVNTRQADYEVEVCGRKIRPEENVITVTGYNTDKTNSLVLFDTGLASDAVIRDGIRMDMSDPIPALTLFLYPDDSNEEGRFLRVSQEYFLSASSVRHILEDVEKTYGSIDSIEEHAVIHLNDTHPVLCIPEMVCQLMDRGMSEEKSIELVKKLFVMTNHTIMPEALPRVPLSRIRAVNPRIADMITRLDRHVREKGITAGPVLQDDVVNMANLACHFSYSVNGVAKIHTGILKNDVFSDLATAYPDKFTNVTNGIGFCRWLGHANPVLAYYMSVLTGGDVIADPALLEKLLSYQDNPKVHATLESIKAENKKDLAALLEKEKGLVMNPDAILTVQAKRGHPYKRQDLNCLGAIWKIQEIRQGRLPATPIVNLIAGKAYPTYEAANDVFHLVLCLQELTDDPAISPWFRVIMPDNYNVSLAEKILPAADISEQISCSSTEASGTSNMKLMCNGAITLGTRDGANVEIGDLVGPDNIFTFGADAETIAGLNRSGSYHPYDYYSDPDIRRVVDFIVSDEMRRIGDSVILERIHRRLTTEDTYKCLLDFKSYVQAKEAAFRAYEDKDSWYKMSLINIARSGFFSSMRTAREYNERVWRLG